jgi:RNA-directed DNA polymerase
VVDARTEGFDFLGFSYHLRRSRKSGKVYPHVEPSRRSVQRLKEWVKQLTGCCRCPAPLDDVMTELNASLRGWMEESACRVMKNIGKPCTPSADQSTVCTV